MGQLLEAEADAALVRIHPDHEQRQLVADVHDLAGRGDGTMGHLRDVQEPIHARLQLDEGAEVGQPHHFAGHA